MSVTLSEHDGRAMLRIERRLAHSQAKVWRAVTKPDELRHWFPAAVSYDPQVGAPITFSFAPDEAESSTGKVVELDPPSTFAFLWEGELLRFELLPDGPGGCVLVFTHQFDDRPGAASFATGWTACLNALDTLLADRPVAVHGGWDGMHEQHEAFIAAFGLDQGSSEETPAGWTVRFERQLTRPVADVWDMLTNRGVDEPLKGEPPPRAFTVQGMEAGAITALDPPQLLEYEWVLGDRDCGRVRWEFAPGPGGAARLVLTQTGPRDLPELRGGAMEAWHAHIERLAKQRQEATP